MSVEEIHDRDHQKILESLDCNKAVTEVKMKLLLAEERIKEMKEDREKSNKTLMWVGAMIFSIVMAVAGNLINQIATVQVLQEKVQEIKKEVEKISSAAHRHD